MRAAALLLALASCAGATEFVQAVEFPYYLYPRPLWERELVWLKNIGVQTVAFSVPADYHEVTPGALDITGRTGPRRDLTGFIKTLRKLGMRGWVRADGPHDHDREWIKLLEQTLATQT